MDATAKLSAAATSNPGISKLTRKNIAKRNRLSRPQKTLLPSKNRSLGRRAQSQTARCNSSGSNAFTGIEHFSSNIPGGKPVYWSLRQEKIWSKNRDIQDSEEGYRRIYLSGLQPARLKRFKFSQDGLFSGGSSGCKPKTHQNA